MRRYIPALLLTLTAFAFPLAGCSELIDKLKNRGAGDDGGAEAAAAELTADAETAPAPTETAAEPIPTTTTAPTVAPTTTATTTKPVATDAGVVDSGAKVDAAAPAVTDAGATKTDSGAAPAPAPTPTFKIPHGLLDGGLFRFDAGGFRLPGT